MPGTEQAKVANQEQDRIHERVRRFASTQDLFRDVGEILVGFSGGGDSTALVLILRELFHPIRAVHLNHGLRAEAAADAAWCDAFCRERGIPFACHTLNVYERQRPGENLEAAARRCRLTVWRDLAGPDTAVALGHQADDALETLLLRLTRGANVSGLTGLRARRTVHGVLLLRPLLCAQRQELRVYLEQQGVSWRCDATNADTARRRNAIRHTWLPMLCAAGAEAGLRSSLDALQDDAAFLEEAAAAALAATVRNGAWADLHPALLPRVLRLWLRRELGRDIVPGNAAVRRLRHELRRAPAHPVAIPLGKDTVLELTSGSLRLLGAATALAPRCWHWRRQPRLELPESGAVLEIAPHREAWSRGPATVETFRTAALPDVLTVRGWQHGDRMVPFGALSAKKVQDLLTDAKVPRRERSRMPVVLAADRIIWVAGLRRAEFGRIHADEVGTTLRLCRTAPDSVVS